MDYAQEISVWSGLPVLFSLPALDSISKETITAAGKRFEVSCRKALLADSVHPQE
jgi:hypothetical protein